MKAVFPYSFRDRRKWLSDGLPFSLREYESRMKRVREIGRKYHLDAIVLHGDANDNGFVRWFANFEPLAGSTFIIILEQDPDPILVSDSVLHQEPMHSLWWTTWIRDLRPSKFGKDNLVYALVQILKEKISNPEGTNVGYTGDYGFPVEEIRLSSKNFSLKNVTSEISRIQMQKSEEEIALMRVTTKIVSRAVASGCEQVKEGTTESEIAGIINGTMMEEGAHGEAFKTIVISGHRTQLKHAPPLRRKMKKGEMVFIDAGSNVFGYLSDICRTLTVGKPNDKQREIMEGAIEIKSRSSRLLRSGSKIAKIGKEAYRTAKEFRLEKEMYVDGHGLGTSMFGPPNIHAGLGKVEPQTTLAYEPMIFSREYGNVSFEDDYLVRDSGLSKLSTLCPQEFW